jgi:hypothetical protein
VLVSHTCNPCYLGGGDREDHGFRLAQASSSRDPISKITRAKWMGGIAQITEQLLSK